jgi:hypothetical protein
MNRPSFKRQLPIFKFRVYYDPVTKICTEKSSAETATGSNFIVVDKAVYDTIEFCSKYVVKDGQLEKTKREISNLKLIKKQTGKFRTIKNNMLFVVDDTYTGAVDIWEYK